MASHRVPIVGLFSGAGGLEIGAHLAGAEIRLAVDNDRICCQTLRSNPLYHPPGTVHEADVSKLDGKTLRKLAGLAPQEACIIIGGPPCQPFSKSSYWTDSGADSRYRQARRKGQATPPKPAPITEARPDGRRNLVQEFLRLVLETDAQGFLFENVMSITHPRNKKVLESFLEEAQVAKFQTLLIRANAIHYGVPQMRQRIVVLGLKAGKPEDPEQTHSDRAAQTLFPLPPPVTAGQSLRLLDDEKYFEREEVVTGRYAKELHEIPPGRNYKALTAWAGHPNPVFEAETRFWSFLLKLSPDLPSWTIQATPGPWVGPFHWTSRRLRTVELAALQTFPVDYYFAGTRRDKVRQIGNAVPVLMAKKMIEPLISAISNGCTMDAV